MLLVIVTLHRRLLRPTRVLLITPQLHFARQLTQYLRKLLRCHRGKNTPMLRRDGYHHPAMHARDLQRHIAPNGCFSGQFKCMTLLVDEKRWGKGWSEAM